MSLDGKIVGSKKTFMFHISLPNFKNIENPMATQWLITKKADIALNSKIEKFVNEKNLYTSNFTSIIKN